MSMTFGTPHIPNYTHSTVKVNVNFKGFITVKLNNVVFYGVAPFRRLPIFWNNLLVVFRA